MKTKVSAPTARRSAFKTVRDAEQYESPRIRDDRADLPPAPAGAMPRGEGSDHTVARSVQLHSLFWLAAANLVGLDLAAELLYPELGDALAPFTYGRWIPLHLDWQLYGWCALPLVGALVSWLSAKSENRASSAAMQTSDRSLTVALRFWSLALLLGGVSWLGGEVSGKLFLDWHGWARPLLPAAMSVLWLALAARLWWCRGEFSRSGLFARIAFLIVLATVPSALYWAAGDHVYPSVNPHSGGATGASLLGSTLGIIAIFGFVPDFLHVPRLAAGAAIRRAFWVYFAASCIVFGLLDHGHASHHALNQVIGLAALVGWIPLSWQYFRTYAWTPASRPWLVAAFGWWTFLLVTGFLTFLPGLSERLKFTHALVAHAHLAMAGFVTSFHLVILNELRPSRPLRSGFLAWQTACAVYVAAMMVLGWQESAHADAFFRGETVTRLLLAVRLAAGAVMTLVSVRWFFQAFRSPSPTMNRLSRLPLPRLLALAAGSMDFATGLGLVLLPATILPLMRVAVPGAETLVFLRFVGAFVGAVGASYLWAVLRGRSDFLRFVLEITIPFRLAAGTYSGVAILLGWLPIAWISVPLADLTLVGLQLWLLRQSRFWSDDRPHA